MNNAVLFGKVSDEWRTPKATFDALNAEFGFDHDAAAAAENSWVNYHYFGPDHHRSEQRDALEVASWLPYGPVIWLNPPYSKCRQFMAKATEEARKGCTVVCLVPSRTDTKWWHEHVWVGGAPRPGVEVRFVKGRLKFGGRSASFKVTQKNSAPFPSVVIIFRPLATV